MTNNANPHDKAKSIELNEHTSWILGRPNFWCISIAERLRELGHEIGTKAEEEQAAVIHFLLNMYLEHGESFKSEANAYLKEKVK